MAAYWKVEESMKTLRIGDIYEKEAQDLLNSKRSVSIVHATGDIDASGDELEIPIRKFLRKRLPEKYYVGHGHIVDKNLNISAQFDVIIADSSATPILYDTENGTEYFPYESVYAIGEIKSTYNKNSKQIVNFSNSIDTLKSQMVREAVNKHYIGHGVQLGEQFGISGVKDIRNNLFNFIVFGGSGNCTTADVRAQLAQNNRNSNPNVMCFLDGAIVTQLETDNQGNPISSYVFEPWDEQIIKTKLARLKYTHDKKSGMALAVLLLSLSNHLSKTLLKSPNMTDYLTTMLAESSSEGEVVGI